MNVRTPHKLDRLLLSPSYRKGAYDSHGIDCPFVFFHEGCYRMTFVGFDGRGYQTGMARSDDLLTWEKQGLLIGRGPAGSVTAHNVALTGLLRDNALHGPGTLKQVDGRYVGTYHAYPDPGYEEGAGAIGLCYSRDLRQWEVGEPVLRPESGAAWERGGLYKSWIMEADGLYHLFYNAKNRTQQPWIEQTGFATSHDLVHWERHPGNPVLPNGAPGEFDDLFASDPCVLRHEGQWLMFYFGLCSDGHARDGLATSPDLRNWTKSGEILIDVGPPGSLDSRHAHKPAVITRNGRLYHFYCAVAPNDGKPLGEIECREIRGITVATDE